MLCFSNIFFPYHSTNTHNWPFGVSFLHLHPVLDLSQRSFPLHLFLCVCTGYETPLIHHVPVLIRRYARGGQPVPVSRHRGRWARMGTWLRNPFHLQLSRGDFNRILEHFLAVNVALLPISLWPQLCHLHMHCLLEALSLGGAFDAAAEMVGLRDCLLIRFEASFGFSVEGNRFI